MFTKGLSQQTQTNLATLSTISFVSNYYLAGGTALSLYFGHRFSHDLDFFSPQAVQPEIIRSSLKNIGALEVFQNDLKTFNGQLNKVKLSFFEYPYKLLEPTVEFQKIKIASVVDIGCMKIDAISSRGKKRDFIDLYTICLRVKSLAELLHLFEKKYVALQFNKLHLLKSLVYFEDAEEDAKPVMIDKIQWNEVKTFFQKEVRKLLSKN